jgi:hypothetical protein
MNEDIVTRLRNWHTDHDSAVPRPIDLEAADEIERLRRTLQLMQIDYRTQIAGLKMRCKCGACRD